MRRGAESGRPARGVFLLAFPVGLFTALGAAEGVPGSYIVELSADQPPGGAWDLSVWKDRTMQTGRLSPKAPHAPSPPCLPLPATALELV